MCWLQGEHRRGNQCRRLCSLRPLRRRSRPGLPGILWTRCLGRNPGLCRRQVVISSVGKELWGNCRFLRSLWVVGSVLLLFRIFCKLRICSKFRILGPEDFLPICQVFITLLICESSFCFSLVLTPACQLLLLLFIALFLDCKVFSFQHPDVVKFSQFFCPLVEVNIANTLLIIILGCNKCCFSCCVCSCFSLVGILCLWRCWLPFCNISAQHARFIPVLLQCRQESLLLFCQRLKFLPGLEHVHPILELLARDRLVFGYTRHFIDHFLDLFWVVVAVSASVSAVICHVHAVVLDCTHLQGWNRAPP